VAHGARVVGPARLEGKNFVGFNALVEGATLEQGAFVEILARVGPGVRLRGMRVLPGKNVTSQAEADDPSLGKVAPVGQAQADFLAGVVKVNVELANGYNVLQSQQPTLTGIGPNPVTHFAPLSLLPQIAGQFINDPSFRNRVVGNVRLEDSVAELSTKMGFRDSLRADEGQRVGLGRLGSMSDEVTFHALEDTGIECGTGCHFGRHAVVHGGADDTVGSDGTVLGDNVRVGNEAIVFRSILGNGVVIGDRAVVDRCEFPAGTVIGPREVWIGNQRQGSVEW
jgi:carbonic anhydrase/acetyltransferase-like protein (isoleucine patch superfamily)